jgi:hypothetical protein
MERWKKAVESNVRKTVRSEPFAGRLRSGAGGENAKIRHM